MYSLYYPFYAIEEADEQQIKKAKIGHLGLLAQTCLKYSYEFDLVIQAADTYSSSFTLKSDPSKKKVSHAQKVISHFSYLINYITKGSIDSTIE